MTLPIDPTLARRVDRIVVSQAVTGEAVGMEHYARMVPLATTTDERIDLLEDAYRERAHLLAMREVARRLGIPVDEQARDPYWDPIRAAFRERADAGDLLACSIVQDVILEAYAIVLYDAMLPAVGEELAAPIRKIAREERGHLASGVERLKAAVAADPDGADARVEWANEAVARVLAEWVRPEPCAPVCSVCGVVGGECAKPDLERAGVDTEGFQPAFAELYGRALRDAGLPSARVARWLARLLA